MKRHWFYILLSLSTRDRHGSEVMRDVLELTGGELRLWPATLYGSLDELRERGWIAALDEPAERPEGASERKRFYRITPAGRAAVVEETGRMAGVLAAAKKRLGAW